MAWAGSRFLSFSSKGKTRFQGKVFGDRAPEWARPVDLASAEGMVCRCLRSSFFLGPHPRVQARHASAHLRPSHLLYASAACAAWLLPACLPGCLVALPCLACACVPVRTKCRGMSGPSTKRARTWCDPRARRDARPRIRDCCLSAALPRRPACPAAWLPGCLCWPACRPLARVRCGAPTCTWWATIVVGTERRKVRGTQ